MLRIGSQKGFTIVEGLLIAIIVGLLGSTGWYVWHAKKNAEKNFSAANSSGSPTYIVKKKSSGSGSSNSASSPTYKSSPASSSTKKSSLGPCGGEQATIANGNVVCDMAISESILPVEVRLLAPPGSPSIKVNCATTEACTDSAYGQPATYFTTKTYSSQFSFIVVKAVKITISMPVTRTREGSQNGRLGAFTDTSSYWIYGSSHGIRCCGTNPPLIYDIYNGYAETFKPY
jgi:cytoskeletal protein RodZ